MLKDYLKGPVWILWIVFGMIAALSVMLLTGHGVNLIAGFNTASKEEKEQHDQKKMSRIAGAFLGVIALFILAMAIWNAVLPIAFVYAFMGLTLVGSMVMVVLLNTVCKKKK